MSTAYLYWLVRYVPDVARGEFVNVAVIAGRDEGDWAIRVAPNLRRASRLGGDASVLRPWLSDLEHTIHAYEHPPLAFFARRDDVRVSRAWLELLTHRFNNVLQLSPASPVEATNAQDAVNFLYEILVAAPDPVRRSHTRTRMVSDLFDLYTRTASLAEGDTLIRRPQTVAGRQRGRFDFAVVDHHVDQLSQAFAFDVRDPEALEQELQSWNFIVSRLRDEGADVLSGGRRLHADEGVAIAAAFQEPDASASSRHREVLEAAQDAWRTLGVDAVPSTELDRIAVSARALVSA